MDYSKFLAKKEHAVLAYLSGPHVFGKDRRMRVEGERPAPGYHRFEVSGRNARALEAVDAPDLGDLPKMRGHLVEGWLVSSAASSGLNRVFLLPDDEPPPLAIGRARRWHSGDLVFEALDFDSEAEDAARLLLEQLAPLRDLKHVPATLRTAYGIALAMAVGRRAGTPITVLEAAGSATRIAEGGEPAARELIAVLQRERSVAAARARDRALDANRPLGHVRAPGGGRRAVAPTVENAHERAEAALDGADARMLAARRLGGGLHLEVTFEFMGQRFISVVQALSLQVIDSGVCLAGEDDLVTLDSLPGVIREAIDTHRLVITRH